MELSASYSAENTVSSDAEEMDQRLDLELGTMDELYKPSPGMWRTPEKPGVYCIYKVPDCIRHVNPEAYTPQLLLIGPLHHSLKSQALKSREDITNTKSMGYLNMERHKKKYLVDFARRVRRGGEKEVIDELRRKIKDEEDMIRESYRESTAWISSSEFVEMIMLDSVFIVELLLKFTEKMFAGKYPGLKTGDPLMDEFCLLAVVQRDLILLENQIPYTLLKKITEFCPKVRSVFLKSLNNFFFNTEEKIKDNSEFKHLTDMFRCVRVETLPEEFLGHFGSWEEIDDMYHADKLHSGGVKFKAIDNEYSLDVEFKNGCLNIPSFLVDDYSEITLRNIMALEQSHYCFHAHVCHYIWFLDFLINNEKDVELLVEKGIIKNMLGNHGLVATMLNRLCLGVTHLGSHYSIIAKDVQKHYNNSWNKSSVILRSVYFSNPWRGTATVAAMFLLLLTLVQTATSIIQVLQNNTSVLALPPP